MAKKFPEPAPFSDKKRHPIPLHPVQSSQIAAVGYHPETKTLAVQFTRGTGAIYHYPNVEKKTFHEFSGAESIGSFFGKHIKHLPFEKYAAKHDDAHKAA